MQRLAMGTALAAAILLGAAAPVSALGTDAGTVIENRAMATYDIGPATNLTAYSSTASTTVDEIIDVAVGSAGSGTTFIFTIPAANQPLLFTVTNNGNGTEPFVLTIVESGSDDFDTDPPAGAPATPGVEIYIDDGDAIFTSADAAYGTSLTLVEDEIVNVWVIQDIPAAAGSPGDIAAITLEAAHRHAPFSTVPGTSYTGEGDGGGLTDAVLGVNGGTRSVTKVYELTLTVLNMVKSYAVANTLGTTDPIPGATVTYTIEFGVTGAGGIDNLVITDPIPTNTTFVPASITAGPITADSEALIGSTVTVFYASTTISAVAGTQTITFDVTID
ncbi:MAG: hypothetical protein P1S46_03005 [bacterium]|nr:hypothetical protein [bacterium]MDT8395733.1 hypothetical protein [bacterium]